MTTNAETVKVTIPGWNGSGPGHWQTLWEAGHPEYVRVEQRDWDFPARAEWVATLDSVISEQKSPVILVAHSLGCIAVAYWARFGDPARVAGAFLVTPPWIDETWCPSELTGFVPIPEQRLPFPSLFVASETDAYMDIHTAKRLAKAWGSEFVNCGDAGHINSQSGHGPWPEGLALLGQFTDRLAETRFELLNQ